MSETPLADGARYRAWVEEHIRFGDTDMLGHVNNAVFVTLSETGRIHFLLRSGLPELPGGQVWVIARIVLDYQAELHWPDTVRIGTGVLRIGNSSVTLGQGMFLGERCAATSENVMVLIDTATRRPAPLPEALKAALGAYLI